MQIGAETKPTSPGGGSLARKVIVAVVGGTVLLIGLLLTVLPGPAVVVIPLGLAILASEFAWARRLLARAKEEGGKLGRRLKKHRPRDRCGEDGGDPRFPGEPHAR